MRCAAFVLLSFGVPCALAAKTQRRFTSESKFTDALSVLSRMNANPSALSIALNQGSGAKTSTVVASGNAAKVGGAESATDGSDAAADALTDSIGSLFGDDIPNAMGTKAAMVAGMTAAKATVPKAPAAPVANVPKAPVAPKVEASKAPPAPKVNVPQPPPSPKTKAPQAPPAAKVKVQAAPPVPKAMLQVPAAPKAKAPQAPPAAKVEAQPAPPVPKAKVLQAPAPKAKAPQAPPAAKAKVQPAPAVLKAKVLQAPPAPKANVPKAPSAVPKAIDGTKRSVQATKRPEHSPHPVSKPAATLVHPSIAKKQSKSATPKHSMLSKSVRVGSPPVSKQKPTLSSKKSGPATKHTSGTAQLQPKVPIKVEELEAEVSALKAKLVTVKPLKGTPPPPHQPAAPVAKKAPVAPAAPVVAAASKVAKKVFAAPPPVAVNKLMVANTHPAVSSSVVAFFPVPRQGELADMDTDYGDHGLDASAGQAVPAEHATVKPAPVAAVSPSKAPSPVELPTSSVVSMTMVPIAAVAPASITAEAASEPQSFRGSSFLGSVGDWFHTMFVGKPLPAPLPAKVSPPDPDAGRPPFSTQNIEKTARSTHDDGLADVFIEDEFVRKEHDDIALVETVKREDRALRLDAETPKRPSMPAPANYQHSLGSPHISSFWGTLAEEDADIENAVSSDNYDLNEYARLKALQDDRIATAVTAISGHLNGRLGKARRHVGASALRNTAASAA